MLGQPRGEQIKITLAEQLFLARQAQSWQKTSVHSHQAVIQIFNKERNSGDIFEEDSNLHGIAILSGEPLAQHLVRIIYCNHRHT